MKFRWFVASLILLVICQMQIMGQDNPIERLPPIAAYQTDGGLYVFNVTEDPILILRNDVNSLILDVGTTPIWSTNGELLAYQEIGNETVLYLISIDDLSIQQRVSDLDYDSILNFTIDNENLLYSTFGEWYDASNPPNVDYGVWRQRKLLIEEFSIPSMTRREILTHSLPTVHEASFDGGGNLGLLCPSYGMSIIESRSTFLTPLILADTPYGILTYFDNPDPQSSSRLAIGPTTLVVPAMTSAFLSTNYEQIVFKIGYEFQIGMVNLSTQQTELFELSHIPEALISDGERYFYYSVRIEGDEPLIPDAYWENDQFWYLACNEYINQVAIYRFDIETQEETRLYISDNFSIPWMTLSPNGQELYFTTIPNGQIWRDAMLDNDCALQECIEYLFPNLSRLNLESLQSEVLLENVLKPVINFGYQTQN
ncbi:MAG: hypothetical protein RLP44_01740 [Aggregatilineales bacterium]